MYVTYPGFETGRCSVSRLLSLPFGQADCFLLELQKGGSSPGYVLIDGGRKETQYPPLMDYLQKLGIPSIDLLILTHPHGDHLGWLGQGFPTDLWVWILIIWKGKGWKGNSARQSWITAA